MKTAKGAGTVTEQGGKLGEAAGEALSKFGSWPQRAKTFLGDVRAETRRVTWPSFRQVQATTIVVMIAVALFAAYLGILDWIYTRAIGWILSWGQ